MNIIYTLMDIGIIAGVIAIVKIMKIKSVRRNTEKHRAVRSARGFSNEALYGDVEQREIGEYAPAMNDYAVNTTSGGSNYRYKVNPHSDYITSPQAEASRFVRRTEEMIMQQSMINNHHLNM